MITERLELVPATVVLCEAGFALVAREPDTGLLRYERRRDCVANGVSAGTAPLDAP